MIVKHSRVCVALQAGGYDGGAQNSGNVDYFVRHDAVTGTLDMMPANYIVATWVCLYGGDWGMRRAWLHHVC